MDVVVINLTLEFLQFQAPFFSHYVELHLTFAFIFCSNQTFRSLQSFSTIGLCIVLRDSIFGIWLCVYFSVWLVSLSVFTSSLVTETFMFTV